MKCPYCGFKESKVVDSRPQKKAAVSAAAENVFPVQSASQLMKL